MSISVLGPTFEDLALNVKKNISNISYIFVGRSAGYIGGSLIGGVLFECMNPHLLLGNPSPQAAVVEVVLQTVSNFSSSFFFFSCVFQGFRCWSQRLECVPSLSVSRLCCSPCSCPASGCVWVSWIQVRQHLIPDSPSVKTNGSGMAACLVRA